MAKKDQLIIGVDIGTHAIKVCQLQRTKKGYTLLSLGSASLGPDCVEDGALLDPDKVGEAIKELFKNLKIKNKKIGISISGYSVIVKKVTLDAMSEEELHDHIMSEAEQYIPFDIEDVYLDYQDLKTGTEEGERTDVMLVAAKKEIVDGYLDMLEEQKLQTVLVDVDGFALENIWDLARENGENVALIDIGATKMNINVIAGGNSVLARDIVVGSEQITEQIANALGIDYEEAEKLKLGVTPAGDNQQQLEEIFTSTCSHWVLEIKKAIDLFQSNYPDMRLEKLVLSGGGSKVSGLKEFIAKETGLDILLFNPFANMNYNTKKIDPEYLEAVAPEMAIATGLAIRSAEF